MRNHAQAATFYAQPLLPLTVCPQCTPALPRALHAAASDCMPVVYPCTSTGSTRCCLWLCARSVPLHIHRLYTMAAAVQECAEGLRDAEVNPQPSTSNS